MKKLSTNMPKKLKNPLLINYENHIIENRLLQITRYNCTDIPDLGMWSNFSILII